MAGLQKVGFMIVKEGSIKAEVIDKKKLIDQHYCAIASKSTILKPEQLNVPEDKFHAQFGLSLEGCLGLGEGFKFHGWQCQVGRWRNEHCRGGTRFAQRRRRDGLAISLS